MSGDIKDLSQQNFHTVVGSHGNFQHSFGLNVKGILKPFTTDVQVSGYPSYEAPIVSGVGNADAKGLNPYGKSTIGEGLLWGEANTDINRGIPDHSTVRSLGIKNPMTFVGWGYDTFGYPVPNHNQAWQVSGYISNVVPATGFVNILGAVTPSGSDVSFYDYVSGPLDLRWDSLRKVWTGHHGGVQAGRIRNVHISGDTYDPSGYYFSEEVTYDAELYDGSANFIQVTGVSHVGPKPIEGSYKIKPIPSGDFCFIVNHPDEENVPKLSVWVTELPQVEECSGEELFTGTFNLGDLYFTFGNGSLISTSGSASGVEPITLGDSTLIPYMGVGDFEYGGISYNSLTKTFEVGSFSEEGNVYIRNGGALRIYGNTTRHISLVTPTGFEGPNITLSLPTGVGNPGDVLTTNGSGVMSWTSVGGGGFGFINIDGGTASSIAATGLVIDGGSA